MPVDVQRRKEAKQGNNRKAATQLHMQHLSTLEHTDIG